MDLDGAETLFPAIFRDILLLIDTQPLLCANVIDGLIHFIDAEFEENVYQKEVKEEWETCLKPSLARAIHTYKNNDEQNPIELKRQMETNYFKTINCGDNLPATSDHVIYSIVNHFLRTSEVNADLNSRDLKQVLKVLNSIEMRKKQVDKLDPKMERQMNEVLRKKNLRLTTERIQLKGNCLYESVSDQIFGTSERHALLRKQAAAYLKKNKDKYESFTTENYDELVAKIATDGEWADNLAIVALCELYSLNILIVRSDGRENTISSVNSEPVRSITLCYYVGVHYSSVYDNLQTNSENSNFADPDKEEETAQRLFKDTITKIDEYITIFPKSKNRRLSNHLLSDDPQEIFSAKRERLEALREKAKSFSAPLSIMLKGKRGWGKSFISMVLAGSPVVQSENGSVAVSDYIVRIKHGERFCIRRVQCSKEEYIKRCQQLDEPIDENYIPISVEVDSIPQNAPLKDKLCVLWYEVIVPSAPLKEYNIEIVDVFGTDADGIHQLMLDYLFSSSESPPIDIILVQSDDRGLLAPSDMRSLYDLNIFLNDKQVPKIVPVFNNRIHVTEDKLTEYNTNGKKSVCESMLCECPWALPPRIVSQYNIKPKEIHKSSFPMNIKYKVFADIVSHCAHWAFTVDFKANWVNGMPIPKLTTHSDAQFREILASARSDTHSNQLFALVQECSSTLALISACLTAASFYQLKERNKDTFTGVSKVLQSMDNLIQTKKNELLLAQQMEIETALSELLNSNKLLALKELDKEKVTTKDISRISTELVLSINSLRRDAHARLVKDASDLSGQIIKEIAHKTNIEVEKIPFDDTARIQLINEYQDMWNTQFFIIEHQILRAFKQFEEFDSGLDVAKQFDQKIKKSGAKEGVKEGFKYYIAEAGLKVTKKRLSKDIDEEGKAKAPKNSANIVRNYVTQLQYAINNVNEYWDKFKVLKTVTEHTNTNRMQLVELRSEASALRKRMGKFLRQNQTKREALYNPVKLAHESYNPIQQAPKKKTKKKYQNKIPISNASLEHKESDDKTIRIVIDKTNKKVLLQCSTTQHETMKNQIKEAVDGCKPNTILGHAVPPLMVASIVREEFKEGPLVPHLHFDEVLRDTSIKHRVAFIFIRESDLEFYQEKCKYEIQTGYFHLVVLDDEAVQGKRIGVIRTLIMLFSEHFNATYAVMMDDDIRSSGLLEWTPEKYSYQPSTLSRMLIMGLKTLHAELNNNDDLTSRGEAIDRFCKLEDNPDHDELLEEIRKHDKKCYREITSKLDNKKQDIAKDPNILLELVPEKFKTEFEEKLIGSSQQIHTVSAIGFYNGGSPVQIRSVGRMSEYGMDSHYDCPMAYQIVLFNLDAVRGHHHVSDEVLWMDPLPLEERNKLVEEAQKDSEKQTSDAAKKAKKLGYSFEDRYLAESLRAYDKVQYHMFRFKFHAEKWKSSLDSQFNPTKKRENQKRAPAKKVETKLETEKPATKPKTKQDKGTKRKLEKVDEAEHTNTIADVSEPAKKVRKTQDHCRCVKGKCTGCVCRKKDKKCTDDCTCAKTNCTNH